MTKTLELPESEPVTNPPNYPSSIAELADHFLKGESWVKFSKKILKEAYWWKASELLDESGKVTQLGFQKLTELFDRTSNTRIVVRGGKRKSDRRKPEMSVDDYKIWVWTSNRKFPPGFGLEELPTPDTDPVTNPGDDGAIEVEFVETESNEYDAAAQVEANTAEIMRGGELATRNNNNSFSGALSQLRGFVAAQVENAIVDGVMQGQNRGMVRATEALQSQIPTDVAPVKASRKKSTGSKSA